jgi:hypothetical protein
MVLRLLALVGTGAVLIWYGVALGQMKPRQESGLIVLVLGSLMVALTLGLHLRTAARQLLRHKDLLIPLGLYITAETFVQVLASIPGLGEILTAAWPVKLYIINLSISLFIAIQIILGVLYAGWTTTLVLQVVHFDRIDVVAALADIRNWIWRVLATQFIGWAILLVGVGVAIALGAVSIVLALVLIGLWSLAWNLTTAALLPVVVAERGVFGYCLGLGLRASWAGKRRWWPTVLLQMALLGWLTYFSVTISTRTPTGAIATNAKSSWHVNGFWTGGYEDDCRWHTDLMNIMEVEPLPLVTTLLGLVFGILAVGVKLKIVVDLYPVGMERWEETRDRPTREGTASPATSTQQ